MGGDPLRNQAQQEPDFAAAVAEHGRAMFRFAVTLSSIDDADDLVQDAMARAWTKRGQFDPARGSLRSWLLAIVADQARSRWRRREPIWEPIDPDVITASARDELSVDVGRHVAALPPRQRAAVVLHYFVDLSVEDVATLMGCSPGTVKSTLHDARNSLAQALGETYVQG
jgi:RNA polymerase sigma-70 factor (ECF subfamily)